VIKVAEGVLVRENVQLITPVADLAPLRDRLKTFFARGARRSPPSSATPTRT